MKKYTSLFLSTHMLFSHVFAFVCVAYTRVYPNALRMDAHQYVIPIVSRDENPAEADKIILSGDSFPSGMPLFLPEAGFLFFVSLPNLQRALNQWAQACLLPPSDLFLWFSLSDWYP